MRRLLFLLLIAFPFGVSTPHDALSAIYYVAPDGNDSHPGSSQKPWKTVGYASKRLAAGDVLVVRKGTYTLTEFDSDMITPRVSGAPGSWIVIKGEDPDDRPVIQGRGGLLAAVDVSGRSYVRIENLEIKSVLDTPYSGGLREGIEAGGSGGGDVSHIEIRNVLIHHVEETGINVSGNAHHIRFEGVHIHHTAMASLGCPSPGGGPGWQHAVIYRCLFEHAGNFFRGQERPSPYDRPDGFGIEDSLGPVEIAHTVSRYNLGDGIDSKARNTNVHHCTVANNYGDGVKLWGSGSRVENTLIYGTGFPSPHAQTPWCLLVIESRDPAGDFQIVNNTLFDDDSRPGHYSMVIQYDNCPAHPVNVTMTNNIIAGLKRAYVGGCVDLDARNNLFYNRNDSEDVQIQHGDKTYSISSVADLGLGNKYGDPLFVNPAWGSEGDFHIRQGSPAIDAGADASSMTDVDMQPRVLGLATDIGADEYGPVGTIDTEITVNGHRAAGITDSGPVTVEISARLPTPPPQSEYYLWTAVPTGQLFWYRCPGIWVRSENPIPLYSGRPVSLDRFPIVNASGSRLPKGRLFFYFAADPIVDGRADPTSASVAELEVY